MPECSQARQLASLASRGDTPFIIVALVVVGALLLAAGVSPYWRITPDSALYTGLADSIATGRGYTFAGDPQPSIPPVFPLLLSLARRAAGFFDPDGSLLDAFVYLNAFAAGAGILALVSASLLLGRIGGGRQAALALLFLVTARRFFQFSIVPLTDIPYCAVSWTALWLVLRAESRGGRATWFAAAGFLAIAPLTRLVGMALVAAVGLHYIMLLRRSAKRAVAFSRLLVLLPALITTAVFISMVLASRGGDAFNYYDDLIADRSGAAMLARVAYNFRTLPADLFEAVVNLESIGGLGFAFTAFACVGAAACWRKGMRLPVIYCLLYLVYVALGEEVRPRYVLAVLPFLYVFVITACQVLLAFVSRRAKTALAAARKTFAALAVVIIATNLVYVGREIARNFSGDFYASYRHGEWVDHLRLADHLREEPPKGETLFPLRSSMRVVHVLSSVPVAPPPYHPETTRRPTLEEFGKYVAGRSITALVVDSADAESALLLDSFLASSPREWHKTAEFGDLSLYSPVFSLPGSKPPQP